MSVIRWDTVSILLVVLLAQHGQMTLSWRQFVHRTDIIANGLLDVGPMSLAQQDFKMN